MGEMLKKDGKSIITAIASGLFVKKAISELIASSIESHGIHWPSFVSVFPATMVSSMLLECSPDEIARALSFSGSLSPMSPFESFTQGAQVKDLYGGWGEMIGILSARMSRINCYGGPLTLIEGKRGLGIAFNHGLLKKRRLEKTIQNCKSLKASDINIKPFPSCTSVHPTLTALEKLLTEQQDLDLDKIKRVEIKTYNYAVELSNESNMNKPISLKLNIPFLSAVMLLKRTVQIEDTETPFMFNKSIQEKIMKLSKKIRVNTLTQHSSSLNERKRPAIVEIYMEDGKKYQKMVNEPKWRGSNNIPNSEIEDKFSMLSRDLLSEQTKQKIIKEIWNFEKIEDISTLINNFVNKD
jgi:2-methylcitrate dehydratase PrpD